MKTKLHVSSIGIAVILCVSSLQAQMGGQLAAMNSPSYETAARTLRSAPPRTYNFSKAVLSDIMRLMAEDAGIGFFGLPEGSDGSDRLITFTIKASPFMALETLAKAHGISLIFENGIWYLRPANDQELIGRIYEINYNAQELVTKNSQSGGGSSGGGQGQGGGATAGLDLQGAPDFFVTEPSRILEDVRGLLDLPTDGGSAYIAPTTSVDNVNQLSLRALQSQPELVVRGGSGSSGESAGNGAKVIWNSDSNTLYVVAGRQQHQWIEAYLAAADRPQPMISVEVKFLEVGKNPKTDLGIDWSGTLGEGGLEANLTGASGPIDIDNVPNYSLPTAVLSYSDLNLKLRALYSDSRTKSVSYPRMLTLDNREVSFRSVVNQPVLASSASASLGAGGTTTSAVEYIPIGTVINVLPKQMAGGKILLNVSVTVSDIIGTTNINGNPFPIATSRVYSAPLTVQSGYTVAISGLDAARTSENENGVPFFGRIPILKNAFRSSSRSKSQQHLMMLITPVALNSSTNGITKKPLTKEPWKRNSGTPGYGGGKSAYNSPEVYHAEPSRTQTRIVAAPISEPAFKEPTGYVAAQKKSSSTFGQAPSATARPIVAKPLNAKVEERSVGANSSTVQAAPVAVKAPAPKPAAAPKPVSQKPTAAPAAASVEKETGKSSPAGNQLGQIQGQSKSLRTKLDGLPSGDSKLSPDDGQLVRNVYDESKHLLDSIEKIRGDKSAPLQGELGDVWWNLIQLKTDAIKMSRRSPESLAVNVDGTDEE